MYVCSFDFDVQLLALCLPVRTVSSRISDRMVGLAFGDGESTLALSGQERNSSAKRQISCSSSLFLRLSRWHEEEEEEEEEERVDQKAMK